MRSRLSTSARDSRVVFAAALVGGAIGMAAAAGLTGCGREPKEAAAPERPDPGPPSAIYTVRGQVVSLPDPSKPTSDFQVRHEAIDNFVNADGEVVGMAAMVMPFPLAEGVSVADLKPGDVVEVTFAVWWKPRSHWEATQVVKLPADTPLEFREARPPQAEPAMPPATGG